MTVISVEQQNSKASTLCLYLKGDWNMTLVQELKTTAFLPGNYGVERNLQYSIGKKKEVLNNVI